MCRTSIGESSTPSIHSETRGIPPFLVLSSRVRSTVILPRGGGGGGRLFPRKTGAKRCVRLSNTLAVRLKLDVETMSTSMDKGGVSFVTKSATEMWGAEGSVDEQRCTAELQISRSGELVPATASTLKGPSRPYAVAHH